MSHMVTRSPEFHGLHGNFFIHGTHGEHGFSLKILVKILVKISSRRRSIINPSPKARNSSAFWSRIFVNDYIFSCLSTRNLRGNLHVKSKDLNGPEIYVRFYFLKIFLAVGNILLKKISSKDFLP